MKYETELNGQTVNLELDERDGRITAAFAERRYEVEVLQPEAGIYLLFNGNEVYEARVASADTSAVQVKLRGKTYSVNVIDRKHRRAGDVHSDDSQKQLVAPMPGKVVKLLLNVGDEVAPGQGVVIVEAMKMQNEIKSAKAGRLAEIRVSEGEAVTANQLLAVIE